MPSCPICQRPAHPRAQNIAFPFCSVRCKSIDLGQWFDEKYRVPVDDPTDGAGETAPSEPVEET